MLHHSLLLTCQLAVLGMNIFQSETSDFQDLGKLLAGGFILAVGAGVTFTVVRLRLRNRKPATAEFLSICSVEREEIDSAAPGNVPE
jgi:hypothetical protein